jgi:hypothetical protein
MAQADLLLHNGTVLTLDPAKPRGGAVASSGGRILAVGDPQDLADLRGPHTLTLDLRGACALPAFTDSHCHLNAYGLAMEELDCSPRTAPTIDAIKARVAEAARAAAPGEWVQARAYDDTELVPPRHPTRWDLDEVAPDVPVILRRRCGHVLVANSHALRLAGITAAGPDVEGGTIGRDDRGEPTGLLRERAQQLVRDLVPKPSVDELKRAILRAADAYVKEGFCAVHDASGARMEELAAYRELADEGRLPLRVALMVRDPWIDHLVAAGLATGFGSEWVKIGPYKLFADGGLGARTAAVSLAYQGEPDNRGVLWYSSEELRERTVRAARAGFAVAIHAIGDVAIRDAIDAFVRATDEGRRSPCPHRIEHCVLPTRNHIEWMRRLGIAAAVQPAFLYALGDSWLAAMHPDLASRCYPMRAMQQAGVLLTGGSDCPVVPSDPLRGMQALVTRRTRAGSAIAPAEALDAWTALRLYTDLPPHAMGEQAFRGRLAPGLAADLVVLSASPLEPPADRIADLRVLATITGGAIRYDAGLR